MQDPNVRIGHYECVQEQNTLFCVHERHTLFGQGQIYKVKTTRDPEMFEVSGKFKNRKGEFEKNSLILRADQIRKHLEFCYSE